jgi:hypothetical protein
MEAALGDESPGPFSLKEGMAEAGAANRKCEVDG